MFGSLIRRKRQPQLEGGFEAALESTTVSLTTFVPRPIEQRADERLVPLLREGKLVTQDGTQLLMKVKNLSAGGLAAIVPGAPEIGSAVHVEMSSQKIPASVVWTRDDMVGVKFDQNVDLGELLAGRKQRMGFRARPPRLDIACKASVRVGGTYYNVEVHDISLAGIKVEPIGEYCVGKKVTVVIESLAAIKGEVRWYKDRVAGIVFDQSLNFDTLSEWVGKRLEMASLKASLKK